MTDERRDEETGRALGRAIEAQTVPSTPYAASRLAQRIDRPAGRGWTYALPMAAALALFVAMGAFFASRGPQGGVATPNASATPSVTATTGPSVAPTDAPASAAPQPTLVYFARDGLPPIAATVNAAGGPSTGGPDHRIGTRLNALLYARPDEVPAGAINAAALAAAQSRTTTISVSVAGDVATVEIGLSGGWAARGAAQSQALLQQLVYTITEEPGIRRAMIKDQGKQTATIDQLVVDKPLSREDVLGYDVKSPEINFLGELAADVVDWRASVDDVTPGLGRFVVELRRTGQSPPFSAPAFVAKLEAARNANDQEPGKYVLRLELPDVNWVQTSGEAFKCCQVKAVNKTPIRQVSAYPLGTGSGRPGVGFGIELDDARPWRVFLMESPLRVVVDIGGHPAAVSDDIAVYAPRPGADVARTFSVSGVSRTFEATVTWRLRDSSNRVVANGFTTSAGGSGPQWGTFQISVTAPATVSGNVTLEVLWGSPRDGSDMGLVAIPLQIR
jgi:hypothetical protein